jgi:hypothetical protein
MSQEEIKFLSYEEASQLVGAIQEEEDIHRPDHRILTVYNHDDKEICWFDYDEVMQDVGVTKLNDESREKVTEYILQRIPDWAMKL